MKRIIKAVCMALAVGAVAVPGVAVAGDEIRVSTGLDDSRVGACTNAKRDAGVGSLSGTVVEIGSCDCGEVAEGLWKCVVTYTLRTPD